MATSYNTIHVELFHIMLVMLTCCVCKVTLVEMRSPSHNYKHRLGDTVRLACEFRTHYFNLFDNPVIWTKSQKHESKQINIQGNIKYPFVTQKHRFEVSFKPLPPDYVFELVIRDVGRADNGNYTCEIRGENSRTLGNVTHELTIRVPVQELYITSMNRTYENTQSSMTQLEYTEGVPATLRCVSRGGNPEPVIQLSIGNQQLQDMSWIYSPIFQGPQGLRTIAYSVERYSYSFVAKPEYDRKHVMCAAVVEGLQTNTTSMRIRVNYAPRIHCENATAYRNERNVSISCIVASRPRVDPDQLRWVLERGAGDFNVMKSTAYWKQNVEITENSVRTTLFLRVAGKGRFDTYALVATNSVAQSRQNVTLTQVPMPTTAATSSASPSTKFPHSEPNSRDRSIYGYNYAMGSYASNITFQLSHVILTSILTILYTQSR